MGLLSKSALSGCFLFLLVFTSTAHAQNQTLDTRFPSPQGALLRSLAVPGWGHHYVDRTDWRKGQYHLGADIILIASYFGVNARANSLSSDVRTLASARANTSLSGKSREFELAVANFDNQDEYNDFQRRNRLVNSLFEGPAFFWQWQSTEDRQRFNDIRDDRDRAENQLPALVGLLVVNRVISGITSFSKARRANRNVPQVSFSYLRPDGQRGVTANIRFGF